jgi:hypothetical protein
LRCLRRMPSLRFFKPVSSTQDMKKKILSPGEDF